MAKRFKQLDSDLLVPDWFPADDLHERRALDNRRFMGRRKCCCYSCTEFKDTFHREELGEHWSVDFGSAEIVNNQLVLSGEDAKVTAVFDWKLEDRSIAADFHPHVITAECVVSYGQTSRVYFQHGYVEVKWAECCRLRTFREVLVDDITEMRLLALSDIIKPIEGENYTIVFCVESDAVVVGGVSVAVKNTEINCGLGTVGDATFASVTIEKHHAEVGGDCPDCDEEECVYFSEDFECNLNEGLDISGDYSIISPESGIAQLEYCNSYGSKYAIIGSAPKVPCECSVSYSNVVDKYTYNEGAFYGKQTQITVYSTLPVRFSFTTDSDRIVLNVGVTGWANDAMVGLYVGSGMGKVQIVGNTSSTITLHSALSTINTNIVLYSRIESAYYEVPAPNIALYSRFNDDAFTWIGATTTSLRLCQQMIGGIFTIDNESYEVTAIGESGTVFQLASVPIVDWECTSKAMQCNTSVTLSPKVGYPSADLGMHDYSFSFYVVVPETGTTTVVFYDDNDEVTGTWVVSWSGSESTSRLYDNNGVQIWNTRTYGAFAGSCTKLTCCINSAGTATSVGGIVVASVDITSTRFSVSSSVGTAVRQLQVSRGGCEVCLPTSCFTVDYAGNRMSLQSIYLEIYNRATDELIYAALLTEPAYQTGGPIFSPVGWRGCRWADVVMGNPCPWVSIGSDGYKWAVIVAPWLTCSYEAVYSSWAKTDILYSDDFDYPRYIEVSGNETLGTWAPYLPYNWLAKVSKVNFD